MRAAAQRRRTVPRTRRVFATTIAHASRSWVPSPDACASGARRFTSRPLRARRWTIRASR